MNIAGEAEVAGCVDFGWAYAVASGRDPAVSRAVAEAQLVLAALPRHRVGPQGFALARGELWARRLPLEALLDGCAQFSAGGVHEAVAQTDRGILHRDDAALDVKRLARAQFRGEASDVIRRHPALWYGKRLA